MCDTIYNPLLPSVDGWSRVQQSMTLRLVAATLLGFSDPCCSTCNESLTE